LATDEMLVGGDCARSRLQKARDINSQGQGVGLVDEHEMWSGSVGKSQGEAREKRM